MSTLLNVQPSKKLPELIINYLRRVTTDEQYMARCLQLAMLGNGYVAPNPMVGAIIVHDEKIIAEGYHKHYGEPHAEVNAVNAINDPSILSECTIYVTLEPCAHHGKTPPCADLLVRHQLKKVVIGTTDSHDKVEGKGVQRLKNAGIEVVLGVLEEECREINRHFFTFHEKKRPYILLKWAQTPNGLIDNSEGKNGEISWISSPEMQTCVHQWRHEHQGILVGKNTVIEDNPSLTVRRVKGTNPIRIVLDSQLELDNRFAILNDGEPTIILNQQKSAEEGALTYIETDTSDVHQVASTLFDLGIQSVLIEGGRKTLQSFIDANLWDEAKVIIGTNDFENGTKAPTLEGAPISEEKHFADRILTYINT